MGRLLTRNDFLQRVHEVHGGKYDYTNTVYINNRHKIDYAVLYMVCLHNWQTFTCKARAVPSVQKNKTINLYMVWE